jgi:hypothetical protein
MGHPDIYASSNKIGKVVEGENYGICNGEY